MMLNCLLSITGNEEPQKQAYEFGFAAESAYSMAQTQMKYKKLLEADEVAFEGEIETVYCESLGIDTSQQQAALTLDGDARRRRSTAQTTPATK